MRVACCSVFVVLTVVVRCLLFVVCYLVCVVCCLLSGVCELLCVICCLFLLLVVSCLLYVG